MMNTEPFLIGMAGVITSLFAGHCVPLSEFIFAEVDASSGEQAGGSGLWCGPPTGLVCDASCAAGLGSSCPSGSPGKVGCAKAKLAGWPLTRTDVTLMSGPALLLADFRSKSRLKLARHRVARSVRTTPLPGRNLFVVASYTRCTSVCRLV